MLEPAATRFVVRYGHPMHALHEGPGSRVGR
jgi:hypothetical protein